MRKTVFKFLDLPSNGVTAALIVISIVFLIGGLAGCILAGRSAGEGEAALSGYLEGFFHAALSGDMFKPEFVMLLWKSIRWPLLAYIFGFTPIGLIGIPVLFLVRAFLLSFSIASFFHVLGLKGLLLAFSVFGLFSLVYLPILFVLGIQSFLKSGSIIGRITGETRRNIHSSHSDVLCCLVCFVSLLLCCFIEYSISPLILKSIAEMLNY